MPGILVLTTVMGASLMVISTDLWFRYIPLLALFTVSVMVGFIGPYYWFHLRALHESIFSEKIGFFKTRLPDDYHPRVDATSVGNESNLIGAFILMAAFPATVSGALFHMLKTSSNPDEPIIAIALAIMLLLLAIVIAFAVFVHLNRPVLLTMDDGGFRFRLQKGSSMGLKWTDLYTLLRPIDHANTGFGGNETAILLLANGQIIYVRFAEERMLDKLDEERLKHAMPAGFPAGRALETILKALYHGYGKRVEDSVPAVLARIKAEREPGPGPGGQKENRPAAGIQSAKEEPG
jgi:hypothetical protein